MVHHLERLSRALQSDQVVQSDSLQSVGHWCKLQALVCVCDLQQIEGKLNVGVAEDTTSGSEGKAFQARSLLPGRLEVWHSHLSHLSHLGDSEQGAATVRKRLPVPIALKLAYCMPRFSA